MVAIERATDKTVPFSVGDLRGVGEVRGISAVGEGSAAVRALHQHLAFIS